MLTRTGDAFVYTFAAMASPCEVIVDSEDAALAMRLGEIAEAEAGRIERKFSRYREESALSAINRAAGSNVETDEETAALLDYAAHCFELSDGRFDVTSGVLRRVWRFDGSDRIPSQAQILEVLPLVGWKKVRWRKPTIALRAGMEIDFGGFGKEYAVDSALAQIRAASDMPALVNFGGDLRVTGPRKDQRSWRAAIESTEVAATCEGVLEFSNGAIATSGDARRFLVKDGVRYSHILDPRTGWPVQDPPRSVTVAAPTCVEAGLLSTMAMLQGRDAEHFLRDEKVKAWVVR